MIPKAHLQVEYMRGTGPGGQHKNKSDTACRITHLPTGIVGTGDERSQRHSYKTAYAAVCYRLSRVHEQKRQRAKKARRDDAIHNTPIIRTYDFKRQVVKDHRTKKTALLRDVLNKGQFTQLTEGLDQKACG